MLRPGFGPVPSVPRMDAAAAGAAAAGLALGISEAIAALLPGAVSLVAAVGQVVIDRQPPGAKDFVVALFGTNDKLALEIVVVLVSLAAGAALGVIAARRFAVAAAAFAAFGVLGFLAGLGDQLANPGIVALQTAVSVGLSVQALSWLLARAGGITASSRAAAGPATDPARRSFIIRTAAVGLAALVAGIAGRSLIDRSRTAPAEAGHLPPAADVVPPLAAGTDLAPSTPGLTPIVVPTGDFYRIDTALLIPSVDASTWNLRIHGLVDRETTLTWDELLALPQFEQYVTISCVSNEVGGNLVGNAKWLGVPLKDILEEAGPDPAADQVVSRSDDGFSAGTPTAVMLDGRDAMIAIGMNGEPLPIAHGFPARLVVPGLYGYVSATKWVTDIELTTFAAFDAYWVPRGWSQQAPIKTQSRIDKPRGGAHFAAGQTVIAGVAWAPHRGVSKVEVQVDDGPWQVATLGMVASVDTWRLWSLTWNATPGDHQIRVRATDNAGETQTSQEEPPAPNGATGWHTIRVTVT